MNEQESGMQSFKMTKPKGNLVIKLITVLLSLCAAGLALMFVPVFMMAGYAGAVWGELIIVVWFAIILTTIISAVLIAKQKIKGVVLFSVVAAIFIVVYFLIEEFRRHINFETLWLPSLIVLMVATLWMSRKEFS